MLAALGTAREVAQMGRVAKWQSMSPVENVVQCGVPRCLETTTRDTTFAPIRVVRCRRVSRDPSLNGFDGENASIDVDRRQRATDLRTLGRVESRHLLIAFGLDSRKPPFYGPALSDGHFIGELADPGNQGKWSARGTVEGPRETRLRKRG
jgi:hypothetical protein